MTTSADVRLRSEALEEAGAVVEAAICTGEFPGAVARTLRAARRDLDSVAAVVGNDRDPDSFPFAGRAAELRELSAALAADTAAVPTPDGRHSLGASLLRLGRLVLRRARSHEVETSATRRDLEIYIDELMRFLECAAAAAEIEEFRLIPVAGCG